MYSLTNAESSRPDPVLSAGDSASTPPSVVFGMGLVEPVGLAEQALIKAAHKMCATPSDEPGCGERDLLSMLMEYSASYQGGAGTVAGAAVRLT